MRRAIVIAVTAALFTSLFGGLAAAESPPGASHSSVAQVEDTRDADRAGIWKRCRRLLGDDELTDVAKERCIELWKRWCQAHPRARFCPKPVPPPPPCPAAEVRVGIRCVPCFSVDALSYRPCLPDPCRVLEAAVVWPCPPDPCRVVEGDVVRMCLPDPCRIIDGDAVRLCVPPPCPVPDLAADRLCVPVPCLTTGGLSYLPCPPSPCLHTDGITGVRCAPVKPIDQPADGPVIRPATEPTETGAIDEVLIRPIDPDKPADIRPIDRILDRPVDRLTDRAGNDVHLRAFTADS